MINIETINQAYTKIASLINFTPLIKSDYLSELCNGEVYLKLENLQITNSFKIRGAYNKILSLSEKEKKQGIITASSGNHAQAVAVVAEKLGVNAKIVVPKNTPKIKIQKIMDHDVELVIYGQNYDQAELYSRELANKDKRVYVSAYNDEMIIAGQGTIGLEIFQQCPKASNILVPLGGGGLISGIAIALRYLIPSIKIIGVQTAACPVFYESLKKGKIIDVEMKESIADGMYGGIEYNSITFELVNKFVDKVTVVTEDSIKKAIGILWEKEAQKVEGAAAAAIAPILDNKNEYENSLTVCILSGGNIDDALFTKIISDFKVTNF
ncbi:MAG: threonine/serine dehydratase [Candidatus Thorarchaeota archaeon]